MNLIVHIGVSKTGSTSIQKFLSQDGVEADLPCVYIPKEDDLPGTIKGNHKGLALFSGAKRVWEEQLGKNILKTLPERYKSISIEEFSLFFEKCLYECICKAELLGFDSLLMSNEHLSERLSKEDIQNFGKKIDQYFERKTLIVYLRNQVSAFISLYGESLKHGDTLSFSKWTSQKIVDETSYFDYKRLIENWGQTGWEIIPSLYYDKSSGVNDWDLIGDFRSRVKGVKFMCQDDISRNNYTNVSSGVNEFLVLRWLNIFRLNKFLHPVVFYYLKRFLSKFFRSELFFNLNSSTIDRIEDYYRESNVYIAQKYFDRQNLFE